MKYSKITSLKEVLEVIRNYGMRLNHKNYVLSVILGKFLRYLILAHGIQANLDKIQDLVSMKPPNKMKQIKQLNGMIVALNKCIFEYIKKSMPFFKLLRKTILVF